MNLNILLLFILFLSYINSQNISKAIEYLEKNALKSSIGKCGTYVGNALTNAGFNIRNYNRHGYLYYYDNILVDAGFDIIGNNTDKAYIPSFLPGDIMVHLNTTLHPDGHICMYNGSKWISDFVQNTIKTYSNDNPKTYFFRYSLNNDNVGDNNNDNNKNSDYDKCMLYKIFRRYIL